MKEGVTKLLKEGGKGLLNKGNWRNIGREKKWEDIFAGKGESGGGRIMEEKWEKIRNCNSESSLERGRLRTYGRILEERQVKNSKTKGRGEGGGGKGIL